MIFICTSHVNAASARWWMCWAATSDLKISWSEIAGPKSNTKRSCGSFNLTLQTTYTSSSDESVMRLLINGALWFSVYGNWWWLAEMPSFILPARLQKSFKTYWTLRCVAQTHLGDCAGDLTWSVTQFYPWGCFSLPGLDVWQTTETLVVYLSPIASQAIPVFCDQRQYWCCGWVMASPQKSSWRRSCCPSSQPLVITTACEKLHRQPGYLDLAKTIGASSISGIARYIQLLRCQL